MGEKGRGCCEGDPAVSAEREEVWWGNTHRQRGVLHGGVMQNLQHSGRTRREPTDPTHYHSGRLIWAVITCDFQTSQTEHVHTQLPKRACEVNDTRVSQAAAHFFFLFLLVGMHGDKNIFCVCVSQRASDSQRSKSPKNKVAATSTHHYCTI